MAIAHGSRCNRSPSPEKSETGKQTESQNFKSNFCKVDGQTHLVSFVVLEPPTREWNSSSSVLSRNVVDLLLPVLVSQIGVIVDNGPKPECFDVFLCCGSKYTVVV